jgi:hypothetical protein
MSDNSTQGGSDVIRDVDREGVKTPATLLDIGGQAGPEQFVDPTHPMPTQDVGITLLKRILQLLKPLGMLTGAGSNRLSIDVNNVVGGTMIATQATATNLNANVNTLTTVTNPVPIGNVASVGGATIPAFDLVKTMGRIAYNTGIRLKIG